MSAPAFAPHRSLPLTLFLLAVLADFAYMSRPAWILFDTARWLLLFGAAIGVVYIWGRRGHAFDTAAAEAGAGAATRGTRGGIAFDVTGWLLFVLSLSLRSQPEAAFHQFLAACSLSMLGLAAGVTGLWLEDFAYDTPAGAPAAAPPAAAPLASRKAAETSAGSLQVAA